MRFRQANPTVPEIDMTPMIDIVFQLIAFFMLVTNFERTQADERVKLPLDPLAKPPEVKPEDELVLNIGFDRDKSGRKLSPQPIVFYAGQQIPVLNMGDKLQQESRLYKLEHDDQPPKTVTVVIRADAQVPTGLVQELIRLAQLAGFERFTLKAKQERR